MELKTQLTSNLLKTRIYFFWIRDNSGFNITINNSLNHTHQKQTTFVSRLNKTNHPQFSKAIPTNQLKIFINKKGSPSTGTALTRTIMITYYSAS